MAVEFSAAGSQIVQPGGSVIFTANPVPCDLGLVYWRENTGLVRLASPSIIQGCQNVQPRTCCGMLMADYDVDFHANVQIPEDGEAGETISLAIAIDGAVDPDSSMQSTPAAPEEPDNVGAGIIAPVPWICRCSSLQVINTSAVPVEVIDPNLKIKYDGVGRR